MTRPPSKREWEARMQASGIGPTRKDQDGCIVTIRDQQTGEQRSRHFPGYRLQAVRRVADWCDELGLGWVVQSYSAPNTIITDLRCERIARQQKSGRTIVSIPEPIMLGKIGRPDLLAPELISRVGDYRQ